MEALTGIFSSSFGSAAATGSAASTLAATGGASTVLSPAGALGSTGASSYGFGSAATGLGGFTGSPSLMSLGSLGSSLFSMSTAKKNAKLQSQMFEMQARQQQLAARQIEIDAQEQGNNVRRQLIDDMASASAFFAARGMSSSGTALNAEIVSRRRANEDLNALMSKGTLRAGGMRAQATQTMAEAKAAKRRGLLNALNEIPNLAESGSSLYGAARGYFGS